MILRNLNIVPDNRIQDLHIKNGRINTIGDIRGTAHQQEFVFDNVIAFPGLINSHDHLDFNLFPQLRNQLYDNYVEWGNDIHAHNKEVINAVLKIPRSLCVKWGLYKNLINGITTVVNHGQRLNVSNSLITVFQQCYTLHSVQLEKNWRFKLNKPFIKKWPFVVHVGEGCDDSSHKEIDTLVKWNLFHRDIIGIHGIAMDEQQAAAFKSLIWCPSSNHFLIGKTAPVDRLKKHTKIIFGTDSTVSASWNIWEHLRLARSMHSVTDEELYAMLTTEPAAVWNMHGRGKIKEGYNAHIVIAKQKNNLHGYDAYYALDPEDILMVIRKGNIKMFDESMLEQVKANNIFLKDFSRIYVGGSVKYIYGDLPALMTEIRRHYPDADFPVKSAE